MNGVLEAFFNGIKSKIPQPVLDNLSEKTATEVEKITTKIVDRLLAKEHSEDITPEIRQEMISMLLLAKDGKQIGATAKYVQSILFENLPKDVTSMRNLPHNITNTLIADAKKRIAERQTIDAEVLP